MYTCNYMYNCTFVFFCAVDRDSSVGIATGYGLDGPAAWWHEIFHSRAAGC